MRLSPLPPACMAICLLLAQPAAAAAATPPGGAGDPVTPAEACDYRCTPTYRETIDYIGKLIRLSPDLRLGWFGESAEGYPLPVVVAARGRTADPERAREAGLPVVLIFSGIHAGEIDGKDASLVLLRDIATGGRASVLEKMVLLVVPIYNVDGHEKVGPHHRLAQNGPVEGMGLRTNGRGLDLNRDFMKMESPETVGLVGQLFRRWRPEVVVDCHVTDGMDFQYVMTHFAGESLNSPPSLAGYVTRMKKVIDDGVRGAGYPSGSFFSFVNLADPSSGLREWVPTPRFSTAYFEAHNRVSILAETHAHKPYLDRVGATLAMLRAIVDEVARDPEAVTAAVRRAEEETMRRAGAGASIALTMETTDESMPTEIETWEHRVVKSEVTGNDLVLWDRSKPVVHTVPFFGKLRATAEVALPRGYLLSRAYGHLAEKAWLHGLSIGRTLEDAEIEVEVDRVTKLAWDETSFQGHHAASAELRRAVERRSVPAGTYWITAGQPGARVAAFLFEARSPDGLLAWNFFDNVLEQKMVATDDQVENLAARMLEEPAVREAWEAALAADPAMREDPSNRLRWFYEQSPYFDAEVGVYPVYRVTGELGVRTAAWEPDRAAAGR